MQIQCTKYIAQVQENGHTIKHVQEESQQSTEILNQQNGTDATNLPKDQKKKMKGRRLYQGNLSQGIICCSCAFEGG